MLLLTVAFLLPPCSFLERKENVYFVVCTLDDSGVLLPPVGVEEN